jgi:hypothetical protein
MHEAPMSTKINIPSLLYQNMHQLFLSKLSKSIICISKEMNHVPSEQMIFTDRLLTRNNQPKSPKIWTGLHLQYSAAIEIAEARKIGDSASMLTGQTRCAPSILVVTTCCPHRWWNSCCNTSLSLAHASWYPGPAGAAWIRLSDFVTAIACTSLASPSSPFPHKRLHWLPPD